MLNQELSDGSRNEPKLDRIISNLYRELKLERKINETECLSIQQNL